MAVKDRTLSDLRSALRACAYAASPDALREYASELSRMDPAVAELARKSAVDIAKISRENPGRGRRVVDELVAKIATEHKLDASRATVADRAAADQLAQRIITTGAHGFNSAEDRLAARRAGAARESLDANGDVAWKQT